MVKAVYLEIAPGAAEKAVRDEIDRYDSARPIQKRQFGPVVASVFKWKGVKVADISWNLHQRKDRHEWAKNDFWETVRLLEIEYPVFFKLALLDWVVAALRDLRDDIESDDIAKTNWKNPTADLWIPVEWDWESFELGRGWGAEYVKFSEEDFASQDSYRSRIESLCIQYCMNTVLQSITKRVAYLRRGRKILHVMPVEVMQVYESLRKDEAADFLSWTYSPFCIGSDKDDEDVKSSTLTPYVKSQLEDCISPKFGTGHIGDVEFTFDYKVCFYPMIIDEAKRNVFYHIRASLAFKPQVDFSVVPSEGQKALWDNIFDAFRGCADQIEDATKSEMAKTEVSTPERKAEFLLSSAFDEDEYQQIRREVIAMGIDPDRIPHRNP